MKEVFALSQSFAEIAMNVRLHLMESRMDYVTAIAESLAWHPMTECHVP